MAFTPVMKRVSLGLAVAAAAAVSTAGAAHSAAGSCSTVGLVPGHAGHARVVALHAQGLTCAKARGIARRVAGEVLAGKPVTLSGVTSYGITQTQCTGCASTTQIALTYPHAKLTISIGGGGASRSPAPFGSGGQIV